MPWYLPIKRAGLCSQIWVQFLSIACCLTMFCYMQTLCNIKCTLKLKDPEEPVSLGKEWRPRQFSLQPAIVYVCGKSRVAQRKLWLGCGLEGRIIGCRFPARKTIFFLFWGHHTAYFVGIGRSQISNSEGGAAPSQEGHHLDMFHKVLHRTGHCSAGRSFYPICV